MSVGQGGPAPVHVTGPRAAKRTWWDLRNARIGAKVAMIVALPVAGLLVLGGLRILTSLQDALDAGQVQEQASLGVRASALVHQLQYERAIATDYLAGDRDAGQVFESEVEQGQQAVQAFRHAETRFVKEYGQNNATAGQLRTVTGRLDTLGDIRKAVLSRELSAPAARERYTLLINDVLDLREGSAFGSADSELVKAVEAAAAVSRAKEFVSQERALLADVLAQGSFGPGQYKDFVYTVAARDAALEQFDSIATPEQANRLQQVLTEEAGRMERTAANAGAQGRLDISPDQWSGAMQSSANGLRTTERSLGDQVIDEAQSARVREARGAVIDTVLIALAILIGLRLTFSVARSMVRRLKTLRSTAIEVAEYSLPDVVQRLQESDTVVHVEDEVAPVEIDSRDEIGDLGRAFNAVHSEALRTATEQAALRRNIATMFINLARRSQTLVDRQLQLIDSLERREQDSERLENLFKLDHLATRMRRNDENLLVLAGQEIVRRWMQPVPLVDVLRAAAGEVEHYRRIDVTTVESSLSVVGQTVNDVVHLLAELLENATGYSPPQTRVTVSARLVTSHVLVEIGDNGIGMPPEQLAEANERLSRPPELDVALSKMMGLFVVGRLALRHGIKVQLRAAPQGGVIAMVMLPEHAIGRASSGGVGERSAESEGAQSGNGPQGRRPALAPEASGPGGRFRGEPSPFAGRRPPSWGPAVPRQPAPSDSPAPAPQERPARAKQQRPPSGASTSGALPLRTPPPAELPDLAPPVLPPQPPVPAPPEPPAPPPAPQQQPPPPPSPPPQPPPPPAPPAVSMPAPPVSASPPAAELAPWTPEPAGRPRPSQEQQETVTLPIFEALESEWFRRRPQHDDHARPAGADYGAASVNGPYPSEPSSPGPSSDGTRTRSSDGALSFDGGPAGTGPSWASPADDGWRAAEAAAEPQTGGTTDAGLPIRVPMAAYVPGGVDDDSEDHATPRRSPESMANLLSSYRQGVEKGRQAGQDYRRQGGPADEDNRENV